MAGASPCPTRASGEAAARHTQVGDPLAGSGHACATVTAAGWKPALPGTAGGHGRARPTANGDSQESKGYEMRSRGRW